MPSAVPTLLPSPLPTAAPTTFDTVKVTYKLTLTGTDAVDLIENNPQALTNTLAHALNISTSSIKNLRLGNITTLTEADDDGSGRRRLTESQETDAAGGHGHGQLFVCVCAVVTSFLFGGGFESKHSLACQRYPSLAVFPCLNYSST
jgi:hypothetical protein